MFIGSLFDKKSPIKYECRYFEGGSKREITPDIISGTNEYGRLQMGFSEIVLMDIGVDIAFSLTGACFVDHIILRQKEGSRFKSARIFTEKENGDLKCIGGFYGQTGGFITDREVVVPIGFTCKNVIIRIETDFDKLLIEDFDFCISVLKKDILWPIPRKVQMENQIALLKADIGKICSKAQESDFAAELLREKLGSDLSGDIPVLFEAIEPGDALYQVPEAYRIEITKNQFRIEANDKRGFIYGVQTVFGLFDTLVCNFPACKIEDRPYQEFRGVHMGLPHRREIPFFKRLIKEFIVPLKYNTLFLQISGGMRYERHPKIHETWVEIGERYQRGELPRPPHYDMVCQGSFLEKAEVADLVDYAKQFGLEVIPEIHSLSHVQYLTTAYPEIAETSMDDNEFEEVNLVGEDQPASIIYPPCYCPSNEKTYEILFDVIDEVLEVVRPERFVNMGHDEAYKIGVCPACSMKQPADLYKDDVLKIYNYLKNKGLTMMIWADMLHPVTDYKTPPCIDDIPRDILLLDFIWYFHLEKDIEDYLTDKGFKVMLGNLNSSHYPRFEKRIAGAGIVGGEVSTWIEVSEYRFACEGKLYEFLYSANMLWSKDYQSGMRLSYNEIIKEQIIKRKALINGNYEPMSGGKELLPRELKGEPIERVLEFPNPYGLEGYLKIGNQEIEILISERFDKIAFLHATDRREKRVVWEPLVVVGEYQITYEDQAKECVLVESGGNIYQLNAVYGKPLRSPYYRHQGYTGTYLADPVICDKGPVGEPVTIYQYIWKNPRPDKVIKSITLKGNEESAASIYLFSILGEA